MGQNSRSAAKKSQLPNLFNNVKRINKPMTLKFTKQSCRSKKKSARKQAVLNYFYLFGDQPTNELLK